MLKHFNGEPMTPTERLKEMLARAEAATEGPWFNGYWSGQCHMKHAHGQGDCEYEYLKVEDNEYFSSYVSSEGGHTIIGGDDSGPILPLATAKFIAASRTEHPMLCKLLIQAIGVAERYNKLSYMAFNPCMPGEGEEVDCGEQARAFLSEVERALGGKESG